jgi:predicted nucleotidyltransferase
LISTKRRAGWNSSVIHEGVAAYAKHNPRIHFEAGANRDDLMSALRAIKQEWRDSLGIEEMGVFGSFARGSATEASDLDVYVRTASPIPICSSTSAIEGRVHGKVNIVRLRERMDPLLRRRIEQEGIDV